MQHTTDERYAVTTVHGVGDRVRRGSVYEVAWITEMEYPLAVFQVLRIQEGVVVNLVYSLSVVALRSFFSTHRR